MQKLKDKDKIFNITRRTAYNWIKSACEIARLADDRAHPHTFRHSFAIAAVMNGINIITINKWLGHADIQNTLIYLKIVAKDTITDMRNFEYRN